MKNPSEWDEQYGRISDRLPHNGWAGYGPYVDKRYNLAMTILKWVMLGGVVLLLSGALN